MTDEHDAATVFLIGAGPGDLDLITMRGLTLLQTADVVVHDRLVAPELVAQARPDALIINVGKAPSKRRFPQAEINRILVEHGTAGKRVARLKGGDPFVYGLGSEEGAALDAAGIAYEVVPGVSSVIAAPAYAGIPITHRGLASSVCVLSGHDLKDAVWQQLPRTGTIVVLMGIGKLAQIVTMVQEVRAAETPIALIRSGTTAGQTVVTGTLANIVERAAAIAPPAMIVIGEVVTLREQLAWFAGAGTAAWFDPAQPISHNNV